ncbi:hypothetical protein EB077_03320 [bacterium]|nr:hypothetical protein [bacterium]
MTLRRAEKYAYYFALTLAVYMPLHIFLAQSLSSITGGLEVWKAAKDVILVLVAFPLLFLAYKQGAFKSLFFKRFIMLGACYVALYMLFLLFDKNADAKSAITGSVYNSRPLGYLLLGYVVANSQNSKEYIRVLLKTTLVICTVVAVLGVLQYFLPKDILTHVGYSIERGVKPNFFIDDKPDFPRVMSTLRDPNSLGAFLALPITYAVYFLFIKKGKQAYKVLSDNWLKLLLVSSTLCLLFTFSRSGLITVIVSLTTLVVLSTKNKRALLKKYAPLALLVFVLAASLLFAARNTYTVQNLLLHADKSTVQQDPNELRISFAKKAINHIRVYPLGEGPSTAGLVAISNPKGGTLTENYYLQIAYEVGVLGVIIFVAINGLIIVRLYKNRHNHLSVIIFSTGLGIAIFGLLNHSWSNEALALQWWLLAGVAVVAQSKKS